MSCTPRSCWEGVRERQVSPFGKTWSSATEHARLPIACQWDRRVNASIGTCNASPKASRTEERGLGLMRAYRSRVRPWRWRSARLLIRALSLRYRSAHAVGGGSRIASRHGRAEASCRGTSMAALHFRSRSDSALRRAVALSTRPRPHPLAIAANVPGDSWPRARPAR